MRSICLASPQPAHMRGEFAREKRGKSVCVCNYHLVSEHKQVFCPGAASLGQESVE